MYHLPCQWNVQLSDNSKSDKCYNQLEEPKVNNKLLRRNDDGMQNSDKLQTISVELKLDLKFQPIIQIIIFAMTMIAYTCTNENLAGFVQFALSNQYLRNKNFYILICLKKVLAL